MPIASWDSEIMGAFPDPSLVTELATSYWKSMTLLAANRLEIFQKLALESLTEGELAKRCGAHPRSLGFLLNALVGLGLLEKEGGRYQNGASARAFLVRGQPAYLGDAIRYAEDLYPLWGRLAESVRENRPAAAPEEILGADPDKTRHFVLGMHNRALGVARSLAASLDLSGKSHLLDVGGGPGTYAAILVEKTAGLRATVLDLEPVTRICRELVAGLEVARRIEVLPGDYRVTPFPAADVVLMSGILHREPEDSARALFAKAFESLPPGGLLVVADVHFEDDRKVSPPFAALFALNMFLTSAHGSAHAQTEISRWLAEAGFRGMETRPLPPPMPHSIVSATKP
jgi:DNA-binding transcriptional ArsR family regulator